SPMTPYRYFKDKDDILAAVRASGFNRFSDALEAAYKSADDPDARSLAVGAAYFRFAFENPAAYRLMFDLAQPTEADYPDLVRASERSKQTIHAYVQGLVDAGRLAGDVAMIAHVFWAAIHGIVVLHLAGKLSGPITVERLGVETLRALTKAYSPDPGAKPAGGSIAREPAPKRGAPVT